MLSKISFWAGKTAQTVKCMPHIHDNLNSSLRHHVKKSSMAKHTQNPNSGVAHGLLASLYSLTRKFQDSERQQKTPSKQGMVPEELQLTHGMHIHAHRHTHWPACTYVHHIQMACAQAQWPTAVSHFQQEGCSTLGSHSSVLALRATSQCPASPSLGSSLPYLLTLIIAIHIS